MIIEIAKTDDQILSCFDAMSELRPHLEKSMFCKTINHLTKLNGYRLAYLSENGIKSVAGLRISEWLPAGKYLEIEDLVTLSTERSKGYGGKLFDWICEYAAMNECAQLRLMSAVTRESAHKFYLRKDMKFEAKYFSLNLI